MAHQPLHRPSDRRRVHASSRVGRALRKPFMYISHSRWFTPSACGPDGPELSMLSSGYGQVIPDYFCLTWTEALLTASSGYL